MNTKATVMFALFCSLLLGCVPGRAHADDIDRRPLELMVDGKWIGAGISYGEYHDGQEPWGDGPTIEQVRGDLHIIAKHWDMIRMYGTRNAELACKVIVEDKLPLTIESNRSEVANVIKLANKYPDIVLAINIGNETQVFWSGHRVEQQTLIDYIREVRANTMVPVSTADDYNYWNKPESRAVADEIDFLGFHAYAMWNSQPLGNALEWTKQQIAEVQTRYPKLQVVHCETGWSTMKHTDGEQAKLIIGEPGEEEQELFYRAYRHWASEQGLAHFYFQAFDEKWKGGPHPNEVEKHWGLFNSDRTPKKAMQGHAQD
jgi:exo-beta-1,3-glucanase (GH17 family)